MPELDDNLSSGFTNMWNRLGTTARMTLSAGAVVCVAIAALVLWWAMRTDYQVLFSNLEPADASAVVQALKTQKVIYHLENEGRTITVPADRVYETRLALMSSGMPLTGGVGFEIFDRQGLGATEQSQRVTYQRALQGELARTIGALEHVRQARVLLVLPESTLFKRDQQKARAAVSLILEQGARLQSDQILGVQRLVAASVNGLDVDQVVISDQRGVTLSASQEGSLQAAASGTRLKLKTDAEEYFTRKITAMLEHVVGPGQAIVSVDATLNFDQITRSLQSLVPLDSADPAKGGGILHRRESHSSGTSGTDDGGDGKGAVNTSSEIDYEFGKKFEQVATVPGALVRLSVSVIVPGSLTAEREAHLLQLVRAAAGADVARGDVVVVESLERIGAPDVASTAAETTLGMDRSNTTVDNAINKNSHAAPEALPFTKLLWVFGVLFALIAIAVVVIMRRQGRLSASAREDLLNDIVDALQNRRIDGQTRI